jgi:hypothetical protein
MSKLDVAKEQIAYLKLWLGIVIVTDISLMGWLLGLPLSGVATDRRRPLGADWGFMGLLFAA